MAEVKKFLFDNFIVGGRTETKLPEPLPEVVEENQPEEKEKEDDVMTWEEAQSYTPEPEETYSKEELEAKAALAEQSGYDRGYAAAQAEISSETNRLMNDISQKLSLLLAKEDVARVSEEDALQVIKKGLQTLVPTLLDEQAGSLVAKFLQDNFNNFKHNEKLSFYIHPDIISYIQDIIVKLANSNDFEGKIAIHKDSTLEKSSCRVEWDDGGVEYTPQEQLAQVEELLDKQ